MLHYVHQLVSKIGTMGANCDQKLYCTEIYNK